MAQSQLCWQRLVFALCWVSTGSVGCAGLDPPARGALGAVGGISYPPGRAGVGRAAAYPGTTLSPWGPISRAARPGGLPTVRGYSWGSCVTD